MIEFNLFPEGRVDYRVIYGDTDAGGVVYHARYLEFCERGRSDLFRVSGVSYKTLTEQFGLHLPISECGVRFLHPARFDDPLTILTRIVAVKSRAILFNYSIEREGETLATAHTHHIFTTREGVATTPERRGVRLRV